MDKANSGSCPHAAIREDISANLHVLEDLQRLFKTEILLIESGGDNLAANYSRELADYIIYVVCISGLRTNLRSMFPEVIRFHGKADLG
jgi:Ni2+-binding GTPase involved in maturation of urease and hydrogenase